MSALPEGHPPIPDDISIDKVVAIITIHDPQAFEINGGTAYAKVPLGTPGSEDESSKDGCHIFLHRVEDHPSYSFGRAHAKGKSRSVHDVYLPGTTVGSHQFDLIPVWNSDCWRLQSASETVAIVNGAPIQHCTFRTKKLQKKLPHAIHLQQKCVNNAVVNGLQIDIWLLKSVRAMYLTQSYQVPELYPQLQDVSRFREEWAQDRYIMSDVQVSRRSYRALERFTGTIETVKVFRDEIAREKQRDAEFLKFAKAEVDASIVRYIQSVKVEQIPAIVTETHEGFAAYAALEEDIKKQHPGLRFSIASKLLRRLFSALSFLHFHGIVHGHVSKKSVLLQLIDSKLQAVLLVDYSSTGSVAPGIPLSLDDLAEDGRAAMEIIEDCCDIWQLRKAATKDAKSEKMMAKITEEARTEFRLVERVVADFLGTKGNSRTSEKGSKLLRLLDMKQNAWYTAQMEQIHNATRREVGPCHYSTIKELETEWADARPRSETEEDQYMILTLGHPYLDGLASKLYHKRWDVSPEQVCGKIAELAGPFEEPWGTFSVRRVVSFMHDLSGFEPGDISDWLASCSEAYPEWHRVLESKCERHTQPQNGVIKHEDICELRDVLQAYRNLPEFMRKTLVCLTANDIRNRPTTDVTETHQVVYHKPSRMFNVTQLHRLASPHSHVYCVNKGNVRCDNYVEVRGEAKLEGHYVPLSLLTAFATQLDLSVSMPTYTQGFPRYDPADFSQVLYHVVLAHKNLLPWASVTREGRQFNFHAPLSVNTFEPHYTFLPTYFGNMKLLPEMPHGREVYDRINRWDKFRTAAQINEAADRQKRNILPAKGRSERHPANPRASSETAPSEVSIDMGVDKSMLTQKLEIREQVRAQACSPVKRNADEQSSEPIAMSAKRSKSFESESERPTSDELPQAPVISASFIDRALSNLERQAQGFPVESSFELPLTPQASFYQREDNANLLASGPPLLPVANNEALTIASEGSFELEDDIRQTEEWLSKMGNGENDSTGLGGLFGFEFHHSLRLEEDGSDAEEETPLTEKAKRKPGTSLKDAIGYARPSTPSSHRGRVAQSFAFNPSSRTSMDVGNKKVVSQSFNSRLDFQRTEPFPARPTLTSIMLPGKPTSQIGNHSGNTASVSNTSNIQLNSVPLQPSPTQQLSAWSGATEPTRGIEGREVEMPGRMGSQKSLEGDDSMPDTQPGEWVDAEVDE